MRKKITRLLNNQPELLILFLLIIFFISCKKTDREKPLITLMSPIDSASYIAGDSLLFDGVFFDNFNLSQYKIDIHNNLDGHIHEKTISELWDKKWVENISGTQINVKQYLNIPSNCAAGWYHLLLVASDESGNQTDFILRSFNIKNNSDTILPVISASTPLNGATYSSGSVLTVNADISDNNQIFICKVNVNMQSAQNFVYQSTDTLTNPQNSYNLLKDIPLNGSSWTSGTYVLTITAYDAYYNKSISQLNFSIL